MRITVLLCIVFICVPISFAADLATSYKQASALADAQEKAPNTKQYFNTVLLPYYGKTYAPVFQGCFSSVSQPDAGTFSFVAAINSDGHVARIFVEKQTNISRCLLAKLEKDIFPAPPEAPFYLHIEMNFGGDTPSKNAKTDAPPLILKDNKYSYTFGVPRDWEFSFEQARARGADLAFFPKGGDFNNSDSVIYTNEVDTKCAADCVSSVSQAMATTLRDIKADSPTVEISMGQPVKMKDGHTAAIRILNGSQDPRTAQRKDREALAFVAHDETVILVVLTSRDTNSWNDDYAAFREVVAGHNFFNCSSPDLAVPCKH